MIPVRNEKELDRMRAAGRIVFEALKLAESMVRPGVNTMDINLAIEKLIVEKGAVPSFKNYNGYPASSCISVDEVVVHGIPSPLTVLSEGQLVSIDIGAYLNGFHGDAARTFPVGEISARKQKLIDVTKESFFAGVALVKDGVRLGDVSAAIQSYAESFGFSVVREMVGHGIGRKMHEAPEVPNYGIKGTGPILKSGNCLAIEPMINMGKAPVEIDRYDGWTCRTKDGLPSAHYENTVIVTDNGAEFTTLYEE